MYKIIVVMSLLGGLFARESNSQVSFKPLLESKFITNEEYVQLQELVSGNKPISKILYDFTPDCLQQYIWNKVNQDYNYRYFKNSYFDYINRKPFWEAEDMPLDIELKVKDDQQKLLESLKKGMLISPKTYSMLNQASGDGVIYKLWEIIEIASTLTKYEEELQGISIANELQPFIQCGYILSADLPEIQSRVQNKEINLPEQIFEVFGKNLRIDVEYPNENEEEYMAQVFGKCLQALPFYKSHSIIKIEYLNDLKDPYHESYSIKHTSITLEFNGTTYIFPFRTDERSYKISNNFDFLIIPKILNYLCSKENNQYHVYINKNYKFGKNTGANSNICSYDLFICDTNFINSFFLKNRLSASKYITSQEKEGYLTALLNILDSDRYTTEQINEIERNVYHSDFNSLDQIPHFLNDFVGIIWYDDLAESYNYVDIINKFISISNGHFNPSNVVETKDKDEYVLSISYNNNNYSSTLLKESVDYDFVKLLNQIQSSHELGGKFYVLNDFNIEDGYCFVFLSQKEYDSLEKKELFRISEIDKVHNIWLEKD